MPAGEGDGGRQLLVDLAQLVPPRHQLIGLGRLMPESLAEVFVVEVRVLVLHRVLGEGGWSAVLRHLLLVDLDVAARGWMKKPIKARKQGIERTVFLPL